MWSKTPRRRRQQLRAGGLTCANNVYCAAGMGHAPDSEVAFEMDANGVIYLRGWFQSHVVGLT